ncbi:alpha/beta hydrolase [Aspergillus novofumigatus IBT 16806]|uniref:Alpha/beta-hydrolase n=1 Tax=Aspergillus novofumigatus (strain IBT 16806) TaxID=1392255 RepID=A0A2I1BW74_ASPN1|nr:alpha/beta-hydrolase [Aspergillus novofumigatus IBT 16806]PKX89637.1 alpha/beta-hydrolase [Aspergillus novofumigatus IBT 16806]
MYLGSVIGNLTLSSRRLELLYNPPNSPNRNRAVIVIAHPWTSIKEQSPANYARILTEAGFTCLAFDAAYQGESEGEPRYLEDPAQRVEDVKSAVTYLISRNDANPDLIGVLGICASGGYAPFAAHTDLRIKAVATSAADTSNMEILKTQSMFTGEKVPLVHMLPERIKDMPADYPDSFRDLAVYYRTKRANPSARAECHLMANFDAFAFNEMISLRSLLMGTGSTAATKWYSEVEKPGAKIVEFFT